MLTLWGPARRFCDGISRRDFLKVGALSLGGLSWADLLRLRAHGAAAAPSTPKAVIMVVLEGGPSQLDMYDLKPEAPAEVRGEFKPIRTRVPGFDICELLPLQAQLTDKLSLVRSMQFRATNHDLTAIFSGFLSREARPAFGAVVSRLSARAGRQLPAYVSLSADEFAPEQFENPSYLGGAHQPLMVGSKGVKGLRLAPEITLDRLEDRKNLLGSFDSLRRQIDHDGKLAAVDAFTAQALDMITSPKALEAFDLSREPDKVRAKYGKPAAAYIYSPQSDKTVSWPGERFLLARRLVEAGVPIVTLRVGRWDHHGKGSSGNIFSSLRSELPLFDTSLQALVTDLHERGLDRDVAVVVWGEMGRTPRINETAGRDHWNSSGFALFAGGGLKMGQVIGATDAHGARPRTHPCGEQNVLATLYRVLGIDLGATIPDHTGRPMYLLDDRAPIAELI